MTRVENERLLPQDGIIPLNPGATRWSIDPAAVIAGLLAKEWNDSNTDGRTPKIGTPELMKAVRWDGRNDFITVWNEDGSGEDPNSIEYGFTSEDLVITLEFITGYEMTQETLAFKGHMHRLREEARRIILANRKDSDPTAFLAQPAGPPASTLNGSTYSQLLTGRQWLSWGKRKTEPHSWKSGSGFGTFRFTASVDFHWRFREVQTS